MAATKGAADIEGTIRRNIENYYRYMAELGFDEIRRLPGGDWVGLYRYAFTVAIVKGVEMDTTTLYDRWCYRTRLEASAALAAWDGMTGEPDGWLRHPASGRCRYDADPERQVLDWGLETAR